MAMVKLKDILNEAKQVGVIYHYTSLSSLFGIIESNRLKASTFEKNNSISFTRDKYFATKPRVGIKTDVRLVFDGNKLSNRYKVQPHQFLGSMKTDIFDSPVFVPVGDEQEERLYLPKNMPWLEHTNDYILRIEFPKKWMSLKFVIANITPFTKSGWVTRKLYTDLNSILKKCVKKGAFEEDDYIKNTRPAVDWWRVGKWTNKDMVRLAYRDGIFDQSKIDRYRPDMERVLTNYFQKPVSFTMET